MKEALKLALEALEHLQPTALTSFYTIGDRDKAMTAIKEALAPTSTLCEVQDEQSSSQEPWMYRIWNDKDAQWRLTDDCSWPAEPIYTTPPKRPWVGLTDEEIEECMEMSIQKTCRAVGAKLKELNT